MTIKELLDTLKPFNAVIQVCPVCSQVDVYKNDGHCCQSEINRQMEGEFYD